MPSIHDKLDRVRKPRVHIKYEVETEGAVVEKELPFVIGVLGDFSGNPTQSLKPFTERKFVQIDRDNFDEVMRRMTPGLHIAVDNLLGGEDELMDVRLKFEKLADFEPGAIVSQVPALKSLLDARNQLRDLLTKADRSEDLELLLERILQNPSELKNLANDIEARRKSGAQGEAMSGKAAD